MKIIKNIVKQRIIEPLSISAVYKIVRTNVQLKQTWDDSLKLFPDFSEHFSLHVNNKEIECRIRLLVVAETVFIREEIENLIKVKGQCHYADIGDSDGSVRLLLKKHFPGDDKFKSTGINLQKTAVEKMKNRGLDAICADALSLSSLGLHYDIVSAFETAEHLPDPIGFFNNLKPVVDSKLIISVPFIRRSRINLAYLTKRWPKAKKATVENTHIFELSPRDWEKIFLHTGWRIVNQCKLMMFPKWGASRLILQPYWQSKSFEGFWFVSLEKCDEYSSQYTVE